MRQQSKELSIVLMVAHHAIGEAFKDGAVVYLSDGVVYQLTRIFQAAAAYFVIENGGIEIFLGGIVPEDHCFRDAGRFGNFFGGGAAKATVRKQPHRHAQNLQAPLSPGHPPAVGNWHLNHRSTDLLAQSVWNSLAAVD